ncbi:RTA1 like protein-domain-containing protein [Mycena belliarum]|uniref:RTA1 like protein-domain-containing protein n=1 Tax=Mycena belliarum TaxID=1033014 RepID=A0AAD6TM34_9AGAR|nr:RTA1 like protein-domain-containing protein [Mycena belliae]
MPLTPVKSPYGYVPAEHVCILFVVLFSLSTVLHLGQAAYYRLWWLVPTAVFAGALEIAGWSARLWSSVSLPGHLFPSFEMQIVCTIIGPTPLAAANFIILGRIISHLGPAYSRLSPKLYTILFLCCDIISLAVQGVGGGIAAGAVNRLQNPARGGHIMLGGIVFQMVTLTAYVVCAGEFLLRYMQHRPLARPGSSALLPPAPLDRRMHVLLSGLVFTTTCLFIRAVYRVIELSNGWTGRIIHTEVYFNVLDGAMITLAILTLNLAHPGALLASAAGKVLESEDGEGKA